MNKQRLASIPQTKDRTIKLSQRQQIYSIPGICERMAKIKANSVGTGETRGQYETKPEETTKKRFKTMVKSEDESN